MGVSIFRFFLSMSFKSGEFQECFLKIHKTFNVKIKTES